MWKNRKGVTLIEFILVIALIGILIPIAYSIFDFSNLSYSMSTNKGFAQQDIRLAGDFVVSEMKYITNLTISEDVVETEYQDYYSLKVEEDEGRVFLTRTFHEYKEDPDDDELFYYITDDVKRISGNWDKIEIKSENTGIIEIYMTQIEGAGRSETKYELPLAVELVNNPSLIEGITIDLLDDIDNNVVYYQKANNTFTDSGIDVLPNDDGTGDPGGGAGGAILISGDDLYPFEDNKEIDIKLEIQGGSPPYEKVSAIITGNANQIKVEISEVKNEGFKHWIEINGNSTSSDKKINVKIVVKDSAGNQETKYVEITNPKTKKK